MNSFQKSTADPNEETMAEVKRKRQQFYKEENAKFETVFSQCKLLHEQCSTWKREFDRDTQKQLAELCNAQHYFDTVDCSAEAMAMSYIDNKSEDNDHIGKLKSDTNLYMGLNNELNGDIKTLSRELEEAKNKLSSEFSLPNEDVYVMDKKIAAYESELAKFEKKHPWLKNPQLDLTYIAKESQTLASMLEEKEALEKELNVYHGLKPDLQEASRQLSEVKKQYKELKDKLHSSV